MISRMLQTGRSYGAAVRLTQHSASAIRTTFQTFYYARAANSLTSGRKENNQPHQQISKYQQDYESILSCPARDPLENVFGIS